MTLRSGHPCARAGDGRVPIREVMRHCCNLHDWPLHSCSSGELRRELMPPHCTRSESVLLLSSSTRMHRCPRFASRRQRRRGSSFRWGSRRALSRLTECCARSTSRTSSSTTLRKSTRGVHSFIRSFWPLPQAPCAPPPRLLGEPQPGWPPSAALLGTPTLTHPLNLPHSSYIQE